VSDFLDQLRDELETAAHRRARWRPGFAFAWSRRTLALAAVVAVAVVSVPAAAVTGVFDSSPPPVRQDASQPTVVDVGPPCVDKREPEARTTSALPPAEVTALLGVLRRPQTPSDRMTAEQLERLSMLPLDAYNPDAIRLAAERGGTRIYLVPATNVRYRRPLPDTEGCKRFKSPELKPVAGVCLVETGTPGGASCPDVGGIRSGLTLMTSGGSNHGTTRAAGVVPDGVSAVIWRVRRGQGFLDTRIPVENNVYAATVPGRHGHGLYVYFETPQGRKLVIAPHKYTDRELALARRSEERDRNAGLKPTVVPRTGTAKTIFTLRMRVKPKNQVYVATWKPPAGSACAGSSALHSLGMLPALSGPEAGLIKLGFGPPPDVGHWCPGHYSGTIRTQRRGRRDVNGPVVGRFSFEVRAG
jgi:hypothetical protein